MSSERCMELEVATRSASNWGQKASGSLGLEPREKRLGCGGHGNRLAMGQGLPAVPPPCLEPTSPWAPAETQNRAQSISCWQNLSTRVMYVLLHFLNHLHKSLLYSHVWRNSSDSESCPVTKGVLQVPFTDGSGRGWKDRHSIKEFPPQASQEANQWGRCVLPGHRMSQEGMLSCPLVCIQTPPSTEDTCASCGGEALQISWYRGPGSQSQVWWVLNWQLLMNDPELSPPSLGFPS